MTRIPEPDSVQELAQEMQKTQERLGEKNNSLVPFIDAYRRITKEVLERKARGEFENPDSMQKLDLAFADRYYRPLNAYLEKGEKRRPWKTYFEYVERDNSQPVIELLLGINAHINADLPAVLRETGYEDRGDFDRVNQALGNAMAPILRRLASERRDFFSAATYVFRPAAWLGLRKIKSWRKDAWRNSRKEIKQQKLDELTEENAERTVEMMHEFGPLSTLKKPLSYRKLCVQPGE